MPQLALAIVLGSLLAFYGNELPDRAWSAFMPILLLLCRYCPGYRFALVLSAAFLWSSTVFHYHLDHRLITTYDGRVVLVRGIVADIPQIDHGRVSLSLQAIEIADYPAAMPRLARFNWYQDEVIPRAGAFDKAPALTVRVHASSRPILVVWLDSSGWLSVDATKQVDHLDDGKRGFLTLVARLRSGTLYRLLDGIDGQDAVTNRDAMLLHGGCHAFNALASNVIEVRRRAPDDGTECDDSVDAPSGRDLVHGDRHFVSAGYADDLDIGIGRAVLSQAAQCAFDERLDDEVIKAGGDDGKTSVADDQVTL